jgi:prepilin-type N-terminal cleavage/methylation domain-containing protein
MRIRSSGFTLIEIMVVVVILAVLGALVVPKIIENVDKARVTRAQSDIRAIQTALDLYRLDNFKYPTTEQGLQALVKQPVGSDAHQLPLRRISGIACPRIRGTTRINTQAPAPTGATTTSSPTAATASPAAKATTRTSAPLTLEPR